MFAAIALVTYLAQPSNTFSGNSASLAAASAPSPAHTYHWHIYTEGMYAPDHYWAKPYTPHHYWPKPYSPQGYTAPGGGGQSAPVQQSTPSYGSPSGIAGTATQSSSGGSPSSTPITTTQSSSAGSSSSTATTTTQSSSGGSSSGATSSSLSDVPGVPQAFAACVAFRESTDLQNPAADGNAYGIIPASGYNVYGMSLASQKQVFAELYAQDGTKPWASDGCA